MSEEAKNKLEDLNTLEVSLVKRAANKRTFALWKDEGGNPPVISQGDDEGWLDQLDEIAKDYEEEDFASGCEDCGYSSPDIIQKTANCPFCFNPTEGDSDE